MLAERGGQAAPLDTRQSVAERQPSEFRLQPFLLGRVVGLCQPCREIKETLLLPLTRVEARFDELDEDAILARVLRSYERLYAASRLRRKRDTAPDRLRC